jgi:hypothetical protein
MRLAVLQSNYVPWKGYFDLMAMSDLFVVYDSVQYTKNDWRNRNLLPTANGTTWLTIPVATSGKGHQAINEAAIDDRRWARKHWQTISQVLARRSAFPAVRELWRSWWEEAEQYDLLHDVNVMFLRRLANQLCISTPLVDDREFTFAPDSPTGRLVQLCTQTGADRYVTGPAGLNYLELDRFAEAGIDVDVIEYDSYPVYPQTGSEFRHGVSVLDLIASVGDEARSHLLGRARCVTG